MTKQEFYKMFKMHPADHLVVDNTIMCPKCMKFEAVVTLGNGICDCVECNKKSTADLGGWPEFVPGRIKEDRNKFFKMTLQPYRDGIPSKEYAEAYPERAKEKFKDEKPQYVYKDLAGWSTRERSLGGEK
jgi:hypothetical protein